MKKDYFRVKEVILRDKMVDISSLPDVISSEVCDKLADILIIDSCDTRIRAEENNCLQITINIKAKNITKC